jgi:hypothetical protein
VAKRKQDAPKIVDPNNVTDALAKSVADGDIVNFRLIFASFSPARADSTESFDDEKYAYLLPSDEQRREQAFVDARALMQDGSVSDHVTRELEANRPSQLPSELLVPLADNGVRLGKWTSAAQAYELLRMRRRMQEEFIKQGLASLNAGNIHEAVRGVRIGAALSYDYAAFPEPMPLVPRYQSKALMLHALYPMRPEECLALLDPDAHSRVALDYLLVDSETAGRLRDVQLDQRVEFITELVAQLDPDWDTFVERFSDACRKTLEFGERSRRIGRHEAETLADEIAEQQADDPWEITRALLGRDLPAAEWWQYLKELANQHPASILFISRQVIGEQEILMPRLRAGAPLATALGLDSEVAEASAGT